MSRTSEVEDYCTAYGAEFEEWTNEEAARLLRQAWILASCLLAAGVWAFHRSQGNDFALLAYMPAILALLACSTAHIRHPDRERWRAVDHTALCTSLATRYEAMLRIILPSFGGQASLVIVCDDVHPHLEGALRSHYQEWDARGPGRTVRDEPESTRAWFRFMPAHTAAIVRAQDGETIVPVEARRATA